MQRLAEHLPARALSDVAQPWKNPSFMGCTCTNTSFTGHTPEPVKAWGMDCTSCWYLLGGLVKNLGCRPMYSSHGEVWGQRQDLSLTELEKGETQVRATRETEEKTRDRSCLSQC